MQWSTAQILEATKGTLRNPAAGATALDGVTIDSRGNCAGMLFVPIRAERDGHRFIAAAVAAGAVAYLAESGSAGIDGTSCLGAVAIDVHDTGEALAALGRAARARLGGPVVGITGSVGKTSTKDLAAAALGTTLRVTASERSFNNELGVPLTLTNAMDNTEVAVIEMGARGPGHVRDLCALAQPTIGVITVVARAHTETFGSVEAVAAAKGELIEALPPAGTAILNGDDPLVAAMSARSLASVLMYSAEGRHGADVIARNVVVDEQLRASFNLGSPWGSIPVILEARGIHQVGNALAAAAVALSCGVPLDATAAGLAAATLSPWRMEMSRSRSGAVILNDAYNANPASMVAALHSLAGLAATRRVAALGKMAELGDAEGYEHRRIAGVAAALGIEVVPVMTDLYGARGAGSMAEAVARIGLTGPDTAVLVKGSRMAALERLATLLVNGR